MRGSICYVAGQGEGVIDAICDERPGCSYYIIFSRGYGQWVKADRVTIKAGAVIKAAMNTSSFNENES